MKISPVYRAYTSICWDRFSWLLIVSNNINETSEGTYYGANNPSVINPVAVAYAENLPRINIVVFSLPEYAFDYNLNGD